jgi:hypothetical protein
VKRQLTTCKKIFENHTFDRVVPTTNQLKIGE